MAAKKQWSEMTRTEKLGGIIGLVVLVFIVIGVVSALAGGQNTANKTTSTSASNTQITGTVPPPPSAGTLNDNNTTAPAKRQVTGKATTLGAGTFTGGKDVVVGLYDVTPGAGQSGNFQVSGTDSYNEILGATDSTLGQVPKVRVQISDGDQIQVSGLSNVTFTPVTTPFITAQKATSLYAGTFTVGQDIGSGRYVVSPGAGQSGNFTVSGSDSYNEILGNDKSMGEVPNLTVNLTDGDIVAISGLSIVTFTPAN